MFKYRVLVLPLTVQRLHPHFHRYFMLVLCFFSCAKTYVYWYLIFASFLCVYICIFVCAWAIRLYVSICLCHLLSFGVFDICCVLCVTFFCQTPGSNFFNFHWYGQVKNLPSSPCCTSNLLAPEVTYWGSLQISWNSKANTTLTQGFIFIYFIDKYENCWNKLRSSMYRFW